MGRPINKRYFGAPTDGGNEIKVQFKITDGASVAGYIVKQLGARRFRCTDGTDTADCSLVDVAAGALANGQMSISVKDDAGAVKQAVKVSGRKVTLDTGESIAWNFSSSNIDTAVEVAEAGGLTANALTGAALNAAGAGYEVADVVTVALGGGVAVAPATISVTEVSTIAAQTEADFAVFVGGDGAGGTAYVAANTITLSDGTVITVNAVDGNGDVTTFSVTTNTVTGITAALTTLTQTATSGTGTGFTLTMAPVNQQVETLTIVDQGSYTTDPTPTTANVVTGGTGTGLTVNLTLAADTGDAWGT